MSNLTITDSGRKPSSLINHKRKLRSSFTKKSTKRSPRKPIVGEPVKNLSLEHCPPLTEKFSKGLWDQKTHQDVSNYVNDLADQFAEKVLRGIARRTISPDFVTKLTALLHDPGATSIPLLTNTEVCVAAYKIISERITRYVASHPDEEVALVTIIDGDGATSHTRTTINLYEAKRKAVGTLRAMSNNFIGISECALFNSRGFPGGGQHLQRHEHAIIFGVGVVAKARQVAARHQQKFKPNFSGARVIDVKRVAPDAVNLARVAAYLFKAPHRCMNWKPAKDGKPGHMNHSEKGDRFRRYVRLAQIRSMMTIEQVTFASGEGQSIRSDMIKFLRALANKDAAGDKRAIHPDALSNFWFEFMKALKVLNWNLPVIQTRK